MARPVARVPGHRGLVRDLLQRVPEQPDQGREVVLVTVVVEVPAQLRQFGQRVGFVREMPGKRGHQRQFLQPQQPPVERQRRPFLQPPHHSEPHHRLGHVLVVGRERQFSDPPRPVPPGCLRREPGHRMSVEVGQLLTGHLDVGHQAAGRLLGFGGVHRDDDGFQGQRDVSRRRRSSCSYLHRATTERLDDDLFVGSTHCSQS